MSPLTSEPYNSRNNASSPVCLPLHGPIAQLSTAPQPKETSATNRAMGNPSPGSCPPCCGYHAWLSRVSGIVTVVPSTIFTDRPRHLHPAVEPPSSRSPTLLPTRSTSPNGNLRRALQYGPVDKLICPSPCATRSLAYRTTTSWHACSACNTCSTNNRSTTSGAYNRSRHTSTSSCTTRINSCPGKTLNSFSRPDCKKLHRNRLIDSCKRPFLIAFF